MRLKPVIASYSGDTFSSIRQYLDESVLHVIASIARSPRKSGEIAEDVLAELVEMHVLKEQDGLVVLDTSVFLRDDIKRILNTVTPIARGLAQQVLESGVEFKDAPPETTVFLGGIVGLVQGLGMNLKKKNIGVDWRNYPGKYAQSKVDFDELCHSLTHPMNGSEASRRYARYLNRYLVDAYAMLVKGEIQNQALRSSAQVANLFRQGSPRTSVITRETLLEHGDAVDTITNIASSYYEGKLHILDELLRSTNPGKQGVPPANMMLNLWRYIRKITAKELYANGFFTDAIPQEGILTVFYENDVELVKRLLL
jgi:ribosomal 50S subunit-associated protein YjgA (DUF615 family)